MDRRLLRFHQRFCAALRSASWRTLKMPYAACKACTDLSDLQRVAAIVLALGLAACSSMPRPTEQIDAARAAVSKAEPVVIQDGAMELRVAQYKLARADQEAQRGDYANAR